MVAFRRGVPVTTTTPTVVVDAGLPAGARRFELVVMDAAGNVSRPMQVTVTIGRLTGPVGPVGPIGPVGPVGPVTPPAPVPPVRGAAPQDNRSPQTAPRRTRPDRSRP